MAWSKAFDEKAKEELSREITHKLSVQCWRCGRFDHKTAKCDKDFDSGILWCRGQGNFSDKVEAEKFFQEKKAHQKIASSGVGAQSMTLKGSKGVGKIDYVQDKTTHIAPPRSSGGIVYEVDRSFLGPEAATGHPRIVSNYVRVNKVPEKLYPYSLEFHRETSTPGKGPTRISKQPELKNAFNALLRANVLKLAEDEYQWATDYRNIWVQTPLTVLPSGIDEWQSPKFQYTLLNGRLADDLQVTVKPLAPLTNIVEQLKSAKVWELSEQIRALNAHVAKYALLNDRGTGPITQFGANKFFLDRGFQDMRTKDNQFSGLRTHRGYYTSIRPSSGGVLLNVNTANSAFLRPMLVSELLHQVKDTRYVEKLLKGKNVRIVYKRQNLNDGFDKNTDLARTKQFKQFGLPANEQKFFKLKNKQVDPNDKGQTVLNYLLKEVHIERQIGSHNFDLICVNVGKRLPFIDSGRNDDAYMRTQQGAQWIPSCLLEILPNQPVTAELSADHTSAMIRHALRQPAMNLELIDKEGLHVLGIKSHKPQGSSSYLGKVGFQVDHNLISFVAKTVKPPNLVHYNAQSRSQQTFVDGERASWRVDGLSFTSCASLNRLRVIALKSLFASEKESVKVSTAVWNGLAARMKAHGIEQSGPTGSSTSNITLEEFEKSISQGSKATDLSLVLLPAEKKVANYSFIKRVADLRHGHPTMIALGGSLPTDRANYSRRQQFFSNLALKANMKLGGVNHWLQDKQLIDAFGDKIRMQDTIVLGADVTHPPAQPKYGCPSIACVVGSVDNRYMKYLGSMRLQVGGQEKIEDDGMCSMVRERLEAWKQSNGRLPKYILVYRDGVSESQLEDVSSSEMKQIKKAYESIERGRGNSPTITFVVVGKRHNTRFYATTEKDTCATAQRGNGNLKPGLLVDSVVTNPKYRNFFLQSHFAGQGTARSAHYHVLADEMELGDKLAGLTMQLCYTFGRCTTGVSYAAPAYMADRLCERGRAYLRYWGDDPACKPIFEPKAKDGSGKVHKLTGDKLWQAKKDFALKISRDKSIWGNFDDTHPDVNKQRLNPWHPNFDDKMFWM